ncbi:unnamed protein product [Paramecium sonneborni]|uniref:Uncharacterized protein n=1 Tax=Paramecium sonneborni TaxID=65129 RepID=A0A8S1L1T0_9CILI|nr:unnamed protein product [Paramecium sonneborni]
MKNIIIIALLLAVAFASLRGSDRKEYKHERDQNKLRKGDRDRSDSSSGSYEDEYSYTLQNSEDNYTYESTSYDSESSESSSGSESSESSSESESYSSEFKHKRNVHHHKQQNRDGRRGPRGRFHNKDQQFQNRKHPHPPRPQDEFSKKVFQNLKKTGKVILEEWNINQDPSIKNEIRAILIANLENLLPVAEVINTQESVPNEPISPDQKDHRPHRCPHSIPPPPPPPQPEDEFANQVFKTLHQIGFEILEQWNLEQDVQVKNQIRANLIQQLSELIPEQLVEVSTTTIIDAPLQIETIQERAVPRLTDENGN